MKKEAYFPHTKSWNWKCLRQNRILASIVIVNLDILLSNDNTIDCIYCHGLNYILILHKRGSLGWF